MSDESFHHQAGGFPLEAAAVRLDGADARVEIVIGESLHDRTLSGADAWRLLRAMAAAGLHYQWPSGALPRQGTLYEVEASPDGQPYRVSWWWASQDGKLVGEDARAFLRSAGVLKICDACSVERLIAPELQVCGHCGYYVQDVRVSIRDIPAES